MTEEYVEQINAFKGEDYFALPEVTIKSQVRIRTPLPSGVPYRKMGEWLQFAKDKPRTFQQHLKKVGFHVSDTLQLNAEQKAHILFLAGLLREDLTGEEGPTDAQRVRVFVEEAANLNREELIEEGDVLLGIIQNVQPLGEGDGSTGEAHFHHLKGLVDAMSNAELHIKKLRFIAKD